MDNKMMLMIPGPTPVPEKVLQAMGKHTIGHRTAAFSAIAKDVTAGLKWLHQTTGDVLVVAASGTGAMEAGMVNFLSAGDRVIVSDNGKFGERWVDMARAFGLDVDEIKVDWGKPLNPETFREKLEADTEKTIKAVVVTHSETSTGVLNDLQTISGYVKSHGALMIVDAVTSLGASPVPVDEWGLDVVCSGSQKGYMMPPGLGFIAVSQKAWQAYETAKLPKFYFDLKAYRKNAAKDLTPFTPPVNLYFALQAALEMMQAEGLESIFARHERLTRATRAGMQAIGLPLFASDESASTAATAVLGTDVLDVEKLRKFVEHKFDIALAGGQDSLKGKIFRIGHLGFASDRDVLTGVAAIEAAAIALGHQPPSPGAGVAAAAQVLG
ncbi:MAG: alanine--glyoxylate aminotransferase family protein [Synechococcales cyanobacterium CRU_2_2]|nr:alanine--glyoxylate aminotransferase family protein [Synechococcales cyanobacterium CRU_2_2]